MYALNIIWYNGRICICNTSLVFKSIWAPCKYLYEYENRQRIKLLGSDYKSELLKKIEYENLQNFLEVYAIVNFMDASFQMLDLGMNKYLRETGPGVKIR